MADKFKKYKRRLSNLADSNVYSQVRYQIWSVGSRTAGMDWTLLTRS